MLIQQTVNLSNPVLCEEGFDKLNQPFGGLFNLLPGDPLAVPVNSPRMKVGAAKLVFPAAAGIHPIYLDTGFRRRGKSASSSGYLYPVY